MVRDLYREADLGEFTGAFTGAVDLHDVAALRITPAGVQGSLTWRPWHGQPMYAPYPEDSKVSPPDTKEPRSGLGRRGSAPKGAAAIPLVWDM